MCREMSKLLEILMEEFLNSTREELLKEFPRIAGVTPEEVCRGISRGFFRKISRWIIGATPERIPGETSVGIFGAVAECLRKYLKEFQEDN